MSLDYWLFQQINNLAGYSAFGDALGVFLASYFQYILSGFLLVYLLVGKDQTERIKNRWMVVLAFLAAIVARLGFTTALHFVFHRARPFVDHVVNQLIAYKTTDSFPSGHASFFFALATALYFFNKKLGFWFFVGAFLISLARVYVGVHYPTDILAGAVVGIFSGWLIWRIFKKYMAI